MRSRFIGRLGMAACLALAACQTPQQEVAAPPPAPELPPPPPAPPPLRVANAVWNFSTEQRCTATAASPAGSIDVAATDRTVVWTVRGPLLASAGSSRALPVAFSGSSSAWTVTGRRAPRGRLVAAMPLSEYQAGQVLVLLGGGTVKLGAGANAPSLRIPNAGPAGRTWFECVRKRLLP